MEREALKAEYADVPLLTRFCQVNVKKFKNGFIASAIIAVIGVVAAASLADSYG